MCNRKRVVRLARHALLPNGVSELSHLPRPDVMTASAFAKLRVPRDVRELLQKPLSLAAVAVYSKSRRVGMATDALQPPQALPARPARGLRASMDRFRDSLPRGNTLPADEFDRRHRVILGLLWVHVPGLFVFAVARGYGVRHSLLEVVIIAAFAALAKLAWRRGRRRVSATLTSVGLLSCSALLVHFWGGVIEAHFHFFVMIVLLTLYEDWVPFLTAALYVLLHHGIGGVIAPGSVYNHSDAIEHPWRWAGIHALFVTAAGAAGVVAWRQQERMRADLREANDALGRSNRELETFAYVASHDLQEPLRTVGGFAQLLNQRYEGKLDPEADEFIGYITEGAARMQSMINDLLVYSRVGRSELPHDRVDLRALAERVEGSLATRIEETGGSVTIGVLPTVTGDSSELARLLQNLISNGLKFHGPGAPPRVEVNAERVDGEWQIAVVDHGIGIPPAQAERVFGMFQRLHARGEYEGTGIGLAVCRKIAERHGGRVWVESNGRGGSRFVVALPAEAEEAR